ncbi:MAG TPA: hypothetical protein VFR81_25335 [Longimicrobium sp.]|nr:hypothetical protein [Longimicrobium sp.]
MAGSLASLVIQQHVVPALIADIQTNPTSWRIDRGSRCLYRMHPERAQVTNTDPVAVVLIAYHPTAGRPVAPPPSGSTTGTGPVFVHLLDVSQFTPAVQAQLGVKPARLGDYLPHDYENAMRTTGRERLTYRTWKGLDV